MLHAAALLCACPFPPPVLDQPAPGFLPRPWFRHAWPQCPAHLFHAAASSCRARSHARHAAGASCSAPGFRPCRPWFSSLAAYQGRSPSLTPSPFFFVQSSNPRAMAALPWAPVVVPAAPASSDDPQQRHGVPFALRSKCPLSISRKHHRGAARPASSLVPAATAVSAAASPLALLPSIPPHGSTLGPPST